MKRTDRWIERLTNSGFGSKPPWLFVTSRELAKALGVHLQTLANWRVREVGPTPAPANFFKGRPARYNVGHVLAWAHLKAGEIIEPWKFNADWLRDQMDFEPWQDRERVQKRVALMMRASRAFRPEALTRDGREGLCLSE